METIFSTELFATLVVDSSDSVAKSLANAFVLLFDTIFGVTSSVSVDTIVVCLIAVVVCGDDP